MRPTRSAFLLFVTFLTSIPVVAQQPQRDPQALAILQQSLAAMGGAQALALQDSQATGTVKIYSPGGPISLPVVVKSKGTKLVRHEVQTQSGTRIRILNQGRGAFQAPDGHVRNLIGNNTLSERVTHLPALSLLAEWTDPSIEIQYVGPANVSGRPTQVIALAHVPISDAVQSKLFRSSTRTLFYIDQATGVVLKTEFKNFAENDTNSSQKAEIFFSDYRAVSGVLVPFRQTTYTDGTLASELSLSSIAFNLGLTDSLFALPVGR